MKIFNRYEMYNFYIANHFANSIGYTLVSCVLQLSFIHNDTATQKLYKMERKLRRRVTSVLILFGAIPMQIDSILSFTLQAHALPLHLPSFSDYSYFTLVLFRA